MKDKVLIVINGNEYFNIVGGSTNEMRSVVLKTIGTDVKTKRYGAISISSNYNEALKAALTENNLRVEKVNIEQTHITKVSNPKRDEIKKQDDQQLTQVPDVSELIQLWNIKPDSLIHGMTGQVFVQEVVSALLYYNNKYPELRYKPSDAANLVIRSKQANIAIHKWHIWRDKKGVINEQLDYRVSEYWINVNYPDAFIHTFEITGNEKEGMVINCYTADVSDRVFMACLILNSDRRDFNIESNKLYDEFKQVQKPKTIDEINKLREVAKNQIARNYSIRTGTAILEATEIYDIQWVKQKGRDGKERWEAKRNDDNKIIIKTSKNGQPIMGYSPNVGSRPLDWVGKKRATVDLAAQIGDINFNNTGGGQYEFGEGKTQFLVENPIYNKVPDDNPNKNYALTNGYNHTEGYMQELNDMTDKERKARFEKNINLLRGQEDEWIE